MTPAVVTDGVPFGEGPVWCPDGTLVITHVAPGALRRVRPASGRSEIVAATRGGANGAQLASDGGFVVAQNGGIDFAPHAALLGLDPARLPPHDPIEPGLQRVLPTGAVVWLARGGFVAPNDLVVDRDGTIYFTDPGHHPAKQPGQGRVMACDRTGAVRTVAAGFAYDNGIALAPDGRLLVVEGSGLMWVGRDGRQEWLVERLPGTSPGDGFCFDEAGRIYVAAPADRCIRVLEADGRQVEVLEAASGLVTNCCFGGADRRTLFATELAPGRVLAWEGLPTPGLALTPFPV